MPPWLITTMPWPALAASLARVVMGLAANPAVAAAGAVIVAFGTAVSVVASSRGRRPSS